MIASAWTALATLLVLMTIVWVVSLRLRDASIVDIVWGPAIALTTWIYMLNAVTTTDRQFVVVGLIHLWAIRLVTHLARRNWGQPEDKRYQNMRKKRGPSFRWTSLVIVFWLQAGIAWLISFPLLVSIQASSTTPLNWLDGLGLTLFSVGLIFETVADWQLVHFQAKPLNAGCVCDRGLWRYTRHPNYFGEALLWWGVWCFAAMSIGALWTIVSPILLTTLLLKVSGVSLLEQTLTDTKPAYSDYIARTSAFLPWFPK